MALCKSYVFLFKYYLPNVLQGYLFVLLKTPSFFLLCSLGFLWLLYFYSFDPDVQQVLYVTYSEFFQIESYI